VPTLIKCEQCNSLGLQQRRGNGLNTKVDEVGAMFPDQVALGVSSQTALWVLYGLYNAFSIIMYILFDKNTIIIQFKTK